jgi:two-component system nitrate/nitrite response regulator NarL
MTLTNVFLVGTDYLFRQGLRYLLDRERFAVIGETRDWSGVEAALQATPVPHLIVADFSEYVEEDVAYLRELRAAYEDVRIVVLADELCLGDMARLLKAGIDGYLIKELSAEALSLSLLLVRLGEKVFPSTLASVLADGSPLTALRSLAPSRKQLTEREEQILRCLLNAYSNKHIARALAISEGTVKVHLKTLMKKISAANRTQAALWARNNGIDSAAFGRDPVEALRHMSA